MGKKKRRRDALEDADGVVAEAAKRSGGFPNGRGKDGEGGPGSSGTPGGGNQGGKRNVPHGFKDFQDFQRFGTDLNNGLRSKYPDAQTAFQGSSVTGRSHDSGRPFDEGRTSDYDIAVSGDSIVDAARARGIEFRSSGRNTPPLSDDQIAELGLTELRDQLSAQAGGRSINFMIYRNMDEALAAKPSIRNWF